MNEPAVETKWASVMPRHRDEDQKYNRFYPDPQRGSHRDRTRLDRAPRFDLGRHRHTA